MRLGSSDEAFPTFTVGKKDPTSASGFKGSLDEIAIYPKAFTVAQVNDHFKVGTAQ